MEQKKKKWRKVFSLIKDKQGDESLFYPMGAHTLYNLVITLINHAHH